MSHLLANMCFYKSGKTLKIIQIFTHLLPKNKMVPTLITKTNIPSTMYTVHTLENNCTQSLLGINFYVKFIRNFKFL